MPDMDQGWSRARRTNHADASLSLDPPPNWTHEALCVQVDPELFYPEKGASSREAIRLCNDCDVREQCLAYALEHADIHGVWGGTSGIERIRILRAMRAGRGAGYGGGPKPSAPHGTEAAYRRHLRHKEPACVPCQEANRIGAGYRRAEQRNRTPKEPAA